MEKINPIEYFDVVIVGAGAAGLTAAIYTSRRALKTLIISKDVGGQAALTTEIENYPGVGLVDGFDLMNRFLADAKKFGAMTKSEEAKKIEKDINNDFIITTNSNQYRAAAVILAFGLTPRDLGVPGEEELKGKGVSYCATCDGPLFKEKIVAVIGGGNSALDAAEYISRIAKKVYLIHRRDKFRGDEILVDRVKKISNIEILYNTNIASIKGTNKVEAIELIDVNNQTIKDLSVDGLFVEIGHVAKTEWVGDLVEFDEHKQIKTNKNCETKTPGLFAAGDVTDINYKQIIISGGEGAKAALQAYRYLQQTKGIKGVNIDWGTAKK